MNRKLMISKCVGLTLLAGVVMMCIVQPCLADWNVVVTASCDPKGTGSNPIIVCKNDPTVLVSFSASVTDSPPVSTSECSVSGPTWHWSGDVNDSSQSVSFPTNAAGPFSKTATATATYTFTSIDPNFPNCPGPDSRSGSRTVTVVVLNDVDGQWTNIRTPDLDGHWPITPTNRNLVATLIDEGPVPRDQTPGGQDGWTYKSYGTGTFTVSVGHDVDKSGTTACNQKVDITNTYSYGIDAAIRVTLNIPISKLLGIDISGGGSISNTTTTTYSYTFGQNGENKKYRYEIWIPWEQIGLHCNVEKFIYTSSHQLYGSETSRIDIDTTLRLLADYKLDATCCPGSPQ